MRGVIGGIRRTYVRSPIKYSCAGSRSLHWPSAVVAPRAATPRPAAAAAATKLRPADRLLRRADRRRRQPRHQHPERRRTSPSTQYNKEHPDCKVEAQGLRLAGRPDQAPALAKKAIDDKTVVGIVGPAFSGESKAADPAFNEAGLPTITPSATNPTLAKQRLEDLLPRPRQRRRAGPRGREVHQGHLKATKVFVIDDASEYGKGLADIVKQDLGSIGHRHRHASSRSRPTSRASVTKVKASGADALFYGGYYAEAGLLVKQLRTPAGRAPFVVGDGVKDPASSRPPARCRQGHDHHLPVRPAGQGRPSSRRLQGSLQRGPGHLLGRGLRRGERSSWPASPPGKTTRADMIAFVEVLHRQGVTSPMKFDAKGESADVTVFAYKVDGRQDRRRQRDQVSTARATAAGGRGSRRSGRPVGCGRLAAASTAARSPGPQEALDVAFLFDNFFELTITGLALGAIYALVALGYTMVYGVLQLINFAHSEVFMFGTFAVAWVVVFLRGTARRPGPRGSVGLLGAIDASSRRCCMSGGHRRAARARGLPAAAQAQRPAS